MNKNTNKPTEIWNNYLTEAAQYCEAINEPNRLDGETDSYLETLVDLIDAAIEPGAANDDVKQLILSTVEFYIFDNYKLSIFDEMEEGD